MVSTWSPRQKEAHTKDSNNIFPNPMKFASQITSGFRINIIRVNCVAMQAVTRVRCAESYGQPPDTCERRDACNTPYTRSTHLVWCEASDPNRHADAREASLSACSRATPTAGGIPVLLPHPAHTARGMSLRVREHGTLALPN